MSLANRTIDLASQQIFKAAAGTAAAPSITRDSDTNTGLFFPAADTIAASTNGTEVMRINSSGDVGIGASPSYKLDIQGGTTIGNNDVLALGVADGALGREARILFGATFSSGWVGSDFGRRYGGGIGYGSTGGADPRDLALKFYTANKAVGTDTPTERLRITSGGEVYIAGTTDQGAYNLQVNGTGVWGAGAYVNGSDERLKENINDITSGLDVVEKLRPVSFQYKEEYTADRSIQSGFIAQDLLTALEGKNYLEGVVSQGPTYYNVAYQNLIPILAKAIQELKAENDSLKSRIAALEAA